MGVIDDWDVTLDDLDEVVTENPSLRGMVFGYLAELKVRKLFFEGEDRISNVHKHDDHDRENKHDLTFEYRGRPFSLEVKSLQSNHVKQTDETWTGKFQCDASDSRVVKFPDGSEVKTTCLLVGDFDLLAVNIYLFTGEWTFAFAANDDLPRSTYRNYTEYQQGYLLKTLMDITWPVAPPYKLDPFPVMDDIIAKEIEQD